MIATPSSISNKTTKVMNLREVEFCVFCFSFFWVLFCGGSFFLTFLSSPKKIIGKNLVVTYKLNTIKGFYHKEKEFSIILVFRTILNK
jgi:hypothetical protein